MESVKVVKKPHTINKIGKNHSILQQYVQKTCQIRLSLFVYGFITVHVSISLSRRLSAKRAALKYGGALFFQAYDRYRFTNYDPRFTNFYFMILRLVREPSL